MRSGGPDPIQDYIQPDTQIEPSIAVNPANPKNAVAVYQEGRIADGGDATNGFATTFDGGKTWKYGELPGLTTYPGQGGVMERASDAVVAFGPNNLVYANSLVFDWNVNDGLRSGITVNVSKDGGKSWGPPVYLQDGRTERRPSAPATGCRRQRSIPARERSTPSGTTGGTAATGRTTRC